MKKITETSYKIFVLSMLLLGGIFFMPKTAFAAYGDTTTFTGKPYDGDGGQADEALLDFPEDVAVDANGNMYIADTYNDAVRKVATDGTISTLAGGGYGFSDGTGTDASFALPRGIATDANDNVYVADTSNNAIRKITPAGVVTTLLNSGLSAPYGIAIAGTTLFILDNGSNSLKSMPLSGGVVTTVATGLNDPRKIAVTDDGTKAYIADSGSHRVLQILVSTGVVSVVAGSDALGYQEGVGAAAAFNYPYGVALSADEQTLYVADPDLYVTDRIRTIDLASGQTSLFAVDTAQSDMIFPAGMAVANNNLYIAMSGLGIVRRYALNDATDTEVFAGTDRFGMREGSDPLFGRPNDAALSLDGKTMYIGDNNRVRKLDMATKASSYITGSIVDNYREGLPIGIGVSTLQEARFSNVAGIVVASDGKALYIADRWNNRIRKVDLTASPVSTSLVTGAGRSNSTGETENGYQEGGPCSQIVDRTDSLTLQSGCAYFLGPTSLALDPSEHYLYVADTGNNRIRRITLSDGTTSLVAGSSQGYADGIGSAAQFNAPFGIAVNSDGTKLYVADRGNHRIRVIDLTTNGVTTLAGAGSAGYREGIGTAAFFSYPARLKIGADGMLYVTESGSHRIRLVDPATGLTKLVSGSGDRGFANGTQRQAKFNGLGGIVPDTANGIVYVLDSGNDTIRQMDVEGAAPYADPAPTITKVEPSDVDPRWTKTGNINVKIRGTGFRYGATVKFYTTKAVKTYIVSSKEIVVTVPIAKLTPGWYDVTVTNVDNQFAVKETAFGVRDPKSGKDSLTGKVPDRFFTLSALRGFTGFSNAYAGGFTITTGNVWGDQKKEIVLGTADGQAPLVKIYSNNGKQRGSFFAFSKTTKTGVRVASCDLDNNGFDEVIAAPGSGSNPIVRIFDRTGKLVLKKGFSALDKKFTGGIHLACADLNGDGKAEIVATGSRGGNGKVYVYAATGKLLSSFAPYGSSFHGGITLGTVRPNATTAARILVAGETGQAKVLVYSYDGKRQGIGISPYGPSFNGGISVSGGDTSGDGVGKIVVTPVHSAGTLAKIFSSATGKRLAQFSVPPKKFTGGIRVAVGDVDGDGVADIATVAAARFHAIVQMFHQNGKPL